MWMRVTAKEWARIAGLPSSLAVERRWALLLEAFLVAAGALGLARPPARAEDFFLRS